MSIFLHLFYLYYNFCRYNDIARRRKPSSRVEFPFSTLQERFPPPRCIELPLRLRLTRGEGNLPSHHVYSCSTRGEVILPLVMCIRVRNEEGRSSSGSLLVVFIHIRNNEERITSLSCFLVVYLRVRNKEGRSSSLLAVFIWVRNKEERITSPHVSSLCSK
jgi:hypothetical protein